MLSMLTKLFRDWVEICLFRRAPQDLPAAGILLVVALLASTLAGVAVARSSLDWPAAVLSAVLETLFMAAIIYPILALQGYTERWLQTVTAVAGTNAVLVMLSLPLLAWLLRSQALEQDATVPALLFLGLIGWNVMVLGHIFRHALSTVLPLGVLVALVYYSASIAFVNWLIPAPVNG